MGSDHDEGMQRRLSMRATSLALFLVVQGCERTPRLLYPDHPIGLAALALRDTAFTWKTRESDHFRIHFQADSYAADHINDIVADAEEARSIGLRVLGEKDFIPRIDVFHLQSRDQMKRITEFSVRGWADPPARTVLLVRSSSANQGERHEITAVTPSTRSWRISIESKSSFRLTPSPEGSAPTTIWWLTSRPGASSDMCGKPMASRPSGHSGNEVSSNFSPF